MEDCENTTVLDSWCDRPPLENVPFGVNGFYGGNSLEFHTTFDIYGLYKPYCIVHVLFEIRYPRKMAIT